MFVTATDPALRLRVIDADVEREFSSAPYPANWPSWSRTNVIAFTGGASTTDVFTVLASGGTPLNFTEAFPTNDRDAEWSHEGDQIVFASDRATPFEEEIFSMNADGTEPRRLTESPGHDLDPAWSPDGDRIIFTSYRDAGEPEVGGELYIMRADGSDPRRLTFRGGFNGTADWKPADK